MPTGVYKRKPFTPEHRAAISKAKRGVQLSSEHCAALSKAAKGVPKSPEHRDAISKGLTGILKSHETCTSISKALMGVPEARAAISTGKIGIPHTSEAQIVADKLRSDKMRGGNDIVNHHWLYDDADLSKYTMPMKRSEHTAMHRGMQSDGYKVPHINSVTDDNGLWGYKSW